uniref:M56 family metallopeptidase n=1 Tax=Paenibacillus polymyxa TaxID=1406 RepID=UPI001D010544
MQHFQNEIKLPSRIRLLEITLVNYPIMYGLLRPTIVLPIETYTKEEQYFIMRHELQHYFYKDNWRKQIIEILCALYWWNPFVYILRKQLYIVYFLCLNMTTYQGFSITNGLWTV